MSEAVSLVATDLRDVGDPVTIADLVGSAPGTAYVQSLVVEDTSTRVRLIYPHGRVVEVAVPALPSADPQVPDGLGRVLAVRARVGGAAARCSVLGSGPGGPRRDDIGWPEALGLAARGVRTVFQTV